MYNYEAERLKREEKIYGKHKARADYLSRKFLFEHNRGEVARIYEALVHAAPEVMDNITIAESYVKRVLDSKDSDGFFGPTVYTELQAVIQELTKLEASRHGHYEEREVHVHHVHERDPFHRTEEAWFGSRRSNATTSGVLLGMLMGEAFKEIAESRAAKKKR